MLIVVPPVHFGPQKMMEKYNCANNAIGSSFYNISSSDSKDFTRCVTPVFDSANPLCKTSVVYCVANNGGHDWW